MEHTEMINRKGARKAQDIPVDVLKLLNKGEIPTVNLTEWLAIDQLTLIDNTFPKMGMKDVIDSVKSSVKAMKKVSTMSAIKTIGRTLYNYYKGSNALDDTIIKLSHHTSDSIRCYATYLIALDEQLSIEEKLNRSMDLIADIHFGIREIVWMALRPEVEKDLLESIQLLSAWTEHPDDNIRRFTTEVIRPRGVWCKHIDRLKDHPEIALPILEKLKSDNAKYVQDSVGNWLNDASKTQPDFVIQLCNQWQKESPTKETLKIIKRARRTIDK